MPDRAVQLDTICALIPAGAAPFHVVELCCGGGLLARAILKRFTGSYFHGYDGSSTMLEKTRTMLQPFGERFTVHPFDLAAAEWRSFPWPVQAVVSSLAIHHLDGDQKRALYQDLYRSLAPTGALAQDGTLSAFDVFQHDHGNIYHYPDPMDKPAGVYEQLRWLKEAGFSDVDVSWLKAGHAI